MKVACCFAALFVAVALGAPAQQQSVDNYVAPPTINVPSRFGGPNATVTKYVTHSHRASLNFACEVDRIEVIPNPDYAGSVEDPLTQIELEDHLGEPANIEWAHVMQMYFQSTDPRGQERQIGTLGGDLGEFLLVLAAVEAEQGKEFTPEEVLLKFKLYLTVMSREKFYYDIDLPAIENLKKACKCPNLNIADPPDSKKDVLLNSTHTPESNGNEFFKKALADPEAFNLRPKLIEAVLDAFFNVMWTKSDALHRRIKFVLLKGELAPKGFVMIKTPGYCNSQLLTPLVSPELCSKQMGIYHGDAGVLLRTEMAGVTVMNTPEEKNAIVRRANELAANALTTVLKDHNEPIFTVSFEGLP